MKCNFWRFLDCFQPKDSSLLLLGFKFGLLSFSSSFLGSGFGLASHIEVETGVLSTDWSDQALFVHVLDKGTCNGTSNLEFFAEDGSGNAKNLWHFLNHSLVLLLVEENSVVKLFINLNFSPWLLLCFGSALGLSRLSIFGCAFTCILCTNLCFFSLK